MEAWFYPSRFYGLENLNSCDWMMDLDPWYDYEPFVHHPRRYRRRLPSPYAVIRRGNDDGRISSRRMAPIRSPFNELFKSDFTDDLISLLEHHARKLSSASHVASRDEPGNSPSKDTTSAIASTTSSENATPSSSRCADIVRKEDVDKTGKPFNVALKLGDFQPENVNVSLDGQKVIVKAKRDEHGDDDSWKRHSEVEYSFMLPEDTPAENLTSRFNKDGILSITAKKDDASNKPLEGPPEKECERKEGQKDGTDDAKGESDTDKK